MELGWTGKAMESLKQLHGREYQRSRSSKVLNPTVAKIVPKSLDVVAEERKVSNAIGRCIWLIWMSMMKIPAIYHLHPLASLEHICNLWSQVWLDVEENRQLLRIALLNLVVGIYLYDLAPWHPGKGPEILTTGCREDVANSQTTVYMRRHLVSAPGLGLYRLAFFKPRKQCF